MDQQSRSAAPKPSRGAERREALRAPSFELLRQLQSAVRAIILAATAGHGCVRCSDGPCIQLFRLIRGCFLAGCKRLGGADAASDDVLLLLVVPEFIGSFARDLDFVAYLCTGRATASFAQQLFADAARVAHFYLECAIMRDEELHLAFVSSLLALEEVGFRPDMPHLAQQCLAASLNDVRLVPVSWGRPAQSKRRTAVRPATALPISDLANLAARSISSGASKLRAAGAGGSGSSGGRGFFAAFLARPAASGSGRDQAEASTVDGARAGEEGAAQARCDEAGDGDASRAHSPSDGVADASGPDVSADTTDGDSAAEVMSNAAEASERPNKRESREALLRLLVLNSDDRCVILEDVADDHDEQEGEAPFTDCHVDAAAGGKVGGVDDAGEDTGFAGIADADAAGAGEESWAPSVAEDTDGWSAAGMFDGELADAFGLDASCAAFAEGPTASEAALSFRDLRELQAMRGSARGTPAAAPGGRGALFRAPRASWPKSTPQGFADCWPAGGVAGGSSPATAALGVMSGERAGAGSSEGSDHDEADDAVLALEGLWADRRSEGARQLLRSIGGHGGGLSSSCGAGASGTTRSPLHSLAAVLESHSTSASHGGFGAGGTSGAGSDSSSNPRERGTSGSREEDLMSECGSEQSLGTRSFSSASTGNPGAADASQVPQLQWRLKMRPRLPIAAQISLQRGLCPGCGERLPTALTATLGPFAPKYCHFLCCYFCRNCHQGDKRLIPARIAERWDFERKGVSSLAARYLDARACEPLFPMTQVRRTRVSSQDALTVLHRLRRQLSRLKEVAESRGCAFLRFMLDSQLASLDSHLAHGYELYTMRELVQLHVQGAQAPFFGTLARLVKAGVDHVEGCEVCRSEAQYCPICASEEPLFDLDVDNYHACGHCGAAYHRKCWLRAAAECPKCLMPQVPGAGARPSLAALQPW
eukprot:TRINITY_DN3563_c0_g2_i1.p1 TRINITY_DN3563_c0_g2~~TRINITY_DN3563_c0_g2_i1.p1  ORF type:complete len:965 (+),score=192.61 TRINITY_DN3563_c0_g2_i1:80-2896(+)